MTGRWDYRRGASLRTFFIGQCLMRFANVYRAWWNREARAAVDVAADHEALVLLERRPVAGEERPVLDRDQVARALRHVKDPRVRRVLLLRADLSNAEIAEQLGVTEKTVERMIANERDRLRRRGIA